MTLKLLLLILVMASVTFQFQDVYGMMLNPCASHIDQEKIPMCNYVTEWNESQRYLVLVNDLVQERSIDFNADPTVQNAQIIYDQIYDELDEKYPGLKEECDKLRAWIYTQIK